MPPDDAAEHQFIQSLSRADRRYLHGQRCIYCGQRGDVVGCTATCRPVAFGCAASARIERARTALRDRDAAPGGAIAMRVT